MDIQPTRCHRRATVAFSHTLLFMGSDCSLGSLWQCLDGIDAPTDTFASAFVANGAFYVGDCDRVLHRSSRMVHRRGYELVDEGCIVSRCVLRNVMGGLPRKCQ